jgi:hypothetical protein
LESSWKWDLEIVLLMMKFHYFFRHGLVVWYQKEKCNIVVAVVEKRNVDMEELVDDDPAVSRSVNVYKEHLYSVFVEEEKQSELTKWLLSSW